VTIINGEISNELGAKLDGTVWFAAAYHRPVDNVLVLADWAAAPLVDSKFTAEATPGPARLRVEAGSVFAEWDIVIPDEGPVEVTALMQDSIDYPEPVVLAAQAAANRATKEANRAEAAAAIVGSAQRVLEAEAASAASATASAASATESADSAAAADSSATTAGEHKDDAQKILDDTLSAGAAAADRATAAATSASDAAESAAHSQEQAEASEKSAGVSRSYNDTAWTARSNALTAKNEAVEAQTAAQTAQAKAEEHAGSAADSCSQAQDAATNAADDVRGELQGLRTEAQTAATASATSAGESADSAEQARLSAESAAEAVSSGVADATPTIKGKLKLAGDLGGSADAPTVPGLGQKAEKVHTHTIGQVDGLQAIATEVQQATYQATPGRIMRRGTDGTSSVATPTGSTHAANKGYVDQAVSSAAEDKATDAELEELRDLVSSRPAMWLWDGSGTWTPPAGSVASDNVLNLKTGEVYSIQEVN